MLENKGMYVYDFFYKILGTQKETLIGITVFYSYYRNR